MKIHLTLLLYTYIFPQKHFRRIDSSLNEAHLLIIFVAPELLLEMMMMMVVVVVINHFLFPTKVLWLFLPKDRESFRLFRELIKFED
jgi:hypothetical protein